MKRMCCLMIVIGILLGVALQAAAATYKIGMLPLIGWSEFTVAKVNGFWEKQGIDVQLVDYFTPLDTKHGNVERRFDFTPAPMPIVQN